MPYQEVNHVPKHILGNLVYIDIRVLQDYANANLPTAFQFLADLRVLGAVVGSTGQIPLVNGNITLPTPAGAVQGRIDNLRGVLADGVTNSTKPDWSDAKSVVFMITGVAQVTLPIKALPGVHVPIDIGHSDIMTLIHRDAAGKATAPA